MSNRLLCLKYWSLETLNFLGTQRPWTPPTGHKEEAATPQQPPELNVPKM